MNELQLFNFIKENIRKTNPELLQESSMICGPLISLMALDFFNKKERDYFFLKEDFIKVDYNPEDRAFESQGFQTSISQLRGKNLSFKVHDTGKKSFITNRISFLEDWFCNNEQIGVVFNKEKIIKTKEFDLFIDKKFLDFGNTFHEKKIIEFFSWHNFYSKEKIDIKFNFQDVLENCYLLLKKGFIRDVSYFFYSSTTFYNNYLDEDLLSPYFFVKKNCKKEEIIFSLFEEREPDSNYIKLEPNKGIMRTHLAKVLEDIGENNQSLYKKQKYWFGLYPLINLLKKSSKTVSNNLIYALILDLYEISDLFQKEKFNKQVSERDINKVLNYFNTVKSKNHTRVILKLKEIAPSVDFYWMIEFISLLSNNDNNAFYGFLENYHFDDLEIEELQPEFLFNKIDDEFWKEQYKNKEEFIEALNLKDFKWNENVTELTSNVDLKLEGENLNHCVGGYGRVLKSKESRIFSIKYKNKRSTVEISSRNNEVIIKQHYSYNNTKPHLYNKVIALRLLNFIKGLNIEDVFNKKNKNKGNDDFLIELLEIDDAFRNNVLNDREDIIDHLDVGGRGLAEILRRFGRGL